MTAPVLPPSRTLLGTGALVAGFYVVAQVAQVILNRLVLSPAADPAADIAQRLLAADRLRQALVLASLVLVPIAYAALAAARWSQSRGAAIVGLAFGVLFSAYECAYRSIDLFAGGRWAAAFVAATDAATRADLLGRFELWEGVVQALYLPLLAAHGLSSAAFAAAVGLRRGDAWDRLLAAALAANAVRALLRIAQMHLGVAALAPVSGALYLPVTLWTYGTLAAWLARASRTLP
jgi:hypothetical protein